MSASKNLGMWLRDDKDYDYKLSSRDMVRNNIKRQGNIETKCYPLFIVTILKYFFQVFLKFWKVFGNKIQMKEKSYKMNTHGF